MKNTSQDRSARPPVVKGGFEDPFSDDFFADVDDAFDSIQNVGVVDAAIDQINFDAVESDENLHHMQGTYLAVTQIHLRPVLRYLKAMQAGVVSKDICALLRFVVEPIIEKTTRVGLTEHAEALTEFYQALKAALRTKSKRVSVEQKSQLIETFAPVQMMFVLEFRGHSTAVVNLLGFFKSIKRRKGFTESDLSKLFGIGIPSISMLRKTSLAELASLTGLSTKKVQSLRRAARDFNVLSLLA